MYGLKAITAAQGWTIAFLGIAVVFSTLAFLAFIMAHLTWLFDMVERIPRFFSSKRDKVLTPKSMPPRTQPHESEKKVQVMLTEDEKEAYRFFELLTGKLGEPFSLQEVLERAEELGLRRPHYGLYQLLKKGLIKECEGECLGFYCWSRNVDVVEEIRNRSKKDR